MGGMLADGGTDNALNKLFGACSTIANGDAEGLEGTDKVVLLGQRDRSNRAE